MQIVDHNPIRDWFEFQWKLGTEADSIHAKKVLRWLPIMPNYIRNGIENYRIGEKLEQKMFCKKFLMY